MAGLSCVLLAAGLGTRMKSSSQKVLHPIFGRPMLDYALDAALGLKPERTVIVVNRHFDPAKFDTRGAALALQKELKGTASALMAALPGLKGFAGTTLVFNGDTPLVTSATLKRFEALHRKHKNALSVLSFRADDPTSYGRIIRDPKGRPLGIVEEKDATEQQKAIEEVNSGVYAAGPEALALLSSIKLNRKKGEYYLTDLVSLALKKGIAVGVYLAGEEEEFLGINNRFDLARAYEVLRLKKVRDLMHKGVSLIDPASTYISPDSTVGPDTIIYPNVFIHGRSKIGRGCTIWPNVRITGSTIKDGSVIKDATLIEDSIVGPEAEVGPMAHLRPGSEIGRGVKIGNFVETKKSRIGARTKAMHLAYLGDADIGSGVNIGAGTITCNYDGRRKHKTEIGDNVFIGSDSQLVAPVAIGRGAYIGAGSTITKNVPPDSLALSRAKQKTFEGWAKKR